MLNLPPELTRLLDVLESPIILLEGTRALPQEDAPKLTEFARRLALFVPHATFRTGNATGSDTAFARGVEMVNPRRIEYMLPYSGHRKANRSPLSADIGLNEITQVAEDMLETASLEVSPDQKSLLTGKSVPKLAAKRAYLLRDTLKVLGDGERFFKANIGIFYTNPLNPLGGGTGHTMRVCQNHNVRVYTQKEWTDWMFIEGATNYVS